MALKHKCPKCGALTIQIVDHETQKHQDTLDWLKEQLEQENT